MISRKNFLLYAFLLVLLGSGAAGCGDNPVDHDDDDEHGHADAHGLRLIINGVEVYRILEGAVSCQEAPCEIVVTEGDETALVITELLDEDGDEIHAEDLDDDFSLGFEIADPSVAEFEQHAEDGKWNFHIVGVQAGVTTMQLQLLHVGHADFTTPPLTDPNALTIRVTED